MVRHFDKPIYRSMAPCGQTGHIAVTTVEADVTCKRCRKALDLPALVPEVTPQVVIDELARMFAKVEPHFIEQTRSDYRANADQECKVWVYELETNPTGTKEVVRFGFKRQDNVRKGQYVIYRSPNHGPTTAAYNVQPEAWAGKQERKNFYYANYERAESDADTSVQMAKTKFIHKQGMKIANALKGRSDLDNVEGRLNMHRGAVVGSIDVGMKNGDSFTVRQQIIVNCRYTPNYTSFYQFPSRFRDIRVGGVDHTTKSEAWMKENF